MSLILVGQTELWDQKLRLQSYAAIRQRIDMNIVLNRLDRAETGRYIAAHMAYAGACIKRTAEFFAAVKHKIDVIRTGMIAYIDIRFVNNIIRKGEKYG